MLRYGVTRRTIPRLANSSNASSVRSQPYLPLSQERLRKTLSFEDQRLFDSSTLDWLNFYSNRSASCSSLTAPSRFHLFKPRAYQQPVIDAMERFKRLILIWHRRAGKDKTCLNITIEQMQKRVGTYYYLFPTYKQGKKVLWEGIDKDGLPFLAHFPAHLIDGAPNNTELKIKLTNGSVFQVVGTDHYDHLVGTNPVGTVWSEYALQDPMAWNLFRPILRENGGWAIFPYTPRGDNHGKELYELAKKNPAWFTQLLTIADTRRDDGTPLITQADVDEEVAMGMDEDLAAQEFNCSFKGAVAGSYFGKLMDQHQDKQVSIPYDNRLPVHTTWDLGVDDTNVIWFIQTFREMEYRFIDVLENSGKGLDFYAKELKEKPYIYGTHYFPHDMNVREIGAVGARSRLATLKTLMQVRDYKVVLAPPAKQDGIDAIRGIIPKSYWNTALCERGISAMKNYHRKWDEKKKKWLDHEEHDWTSHFVDAVQTFALGFKEKTTNKKQAQREVREAHGWMR